MSGLHNPLERGTVLCVCAYSMRAAACFVAFAYTFIARESMRPHVHITVVTPVSTQTRDHTLTLHFK